MLMKFCVAGLSAAAIVLATVAVSSDAEAQNQQTRAAKKSAAKKYGPVPISMDPPPRARITVQRRLFLDAGTYVVPGERKFTDYAIPPGYSPFSVIDNTAFAHRSPLPGPFDLPGRDNPWPWNYCLGC